MTFQRVKTTLMRKRGQKAHVINALVELD